MPAVCLWGRDFLPLSGLWLPHLYHGPNDARLWRTDMIKRGDACEASSTTPPPTWNLRVPSWNLILQGWQNWAVAAGVAEKHMRPWSRRLMYLRPKEISHGSHQSVPTLLLPTGPGYAFPCSYCPTPPPNAATRHSYPGVWKEDSNEKRPPTQRISSWAVTSFRLPFLLL